MKIGSRIALFYTIITVGAIAAVVMVFYFFTSRYINHLYDSYLIEKAYLTAQKHWEKDEVDEYSYREIQQKYDELLPQAQEILLNTDSASAAVNDTLNKYLDSNQQARLFKDFPVPFVYGNLRGAALHYPDNEGDFIVLVMASNNYGRDIQKHILLLALFLLLMVLFAITPAVFVLVWLIRTIKRLITEAKDKTVTAIEEKIEQKKEEHYVRTGI